MLTHSPPEERAGDGEGGLLITEAELAGGRLVDVRVRDGIIVELARRLHPSPGEAVLEAGGGALLPGLRDHHLHLRALGAARRSVPCGPPQVRSRWDLAAGLRGAAHKVPPGTWIRGVGYHEVVAGPLDRHALDAMVPDRPLRIQHRSGRLWMVNSAGLRRLGLAPSDGRLIHADGWLRDRAAAGAPAPDAGSEVAAVGRHLASFGIVGVTDATATNAPHEARELAAAVEQQVLVMGDGRLAAGPLKVVLEDDDLPSLDVFEAEVLRAHAKGRAVAVHCVGRAPLWLALAGFAAAGPAPGDRIEHGSVIPPEALGPLRQMGLNLVTQPNFVAERGAEYLADVDAVDLPWLYRVAGPQLAGVPVAAGTDAPFGDPDPWRAMTAAVSRRTAAGRVLNPEERVSPEVALALFTGPLEDPGRPLRLEGGAPADLCLLAVPWREARSQLSSDLVTATIRAGRLIYHRQVPSQTGEPSEALAR